MDVFQKGLRLQAAVVGFRLIARIKAVGLDEEPARFETAELAVAAQDAAVVLNAARNARVPCGPRSGKWCSFSRSRSGRRTASKW